MKLVTELQNLLRLQSPQRETGELFPDRGLWFAFCLAKVMNEFKQDEVDRAYQDWHFRHYPFHAIEKELKDLMVQQPTGVKPGFLRRLRESLFLTQQRMSENLGVSRATYFRFEADEADGSISINKLRSALKAMECELIISIRPRRLPSKVVWEQLYPIAKLHPWVQRKTLTNRVGALVWAVQAKMQEAKVRGALGWSERRNKMPDYFTVPR